MNMRWIVSFTLMMIIFGTFFGLVLGGINPWTSPAQANQMYMETEHNRVMYALQESLAQAETEAEIREIQRQQAWQDAQHQIEIQAMSQKLARQELAFRTSMTLLTILAGALALALFFGTVIWVGARAMVYIRSISVKEEPMNTYVPPVGMRIPNLAERQAYDALDPNKNLFASRLDERMQEIAAQRDDAEMLVERMRALSDPSKISSEEYRKRPLAS